MLKQLAKYKKKVNQDAATFPSIQVFLNLIVFTKRQPARPDSLA